MVEPIGIDAKDVCERLRAAREATDLSARALGALAGLSSATVALIESAERPNPEAQTLSALARTLGVSLDWLINGTGAAPKASAIKAAVAKAQAEKAA